MKKLFYETKEFLKEKVEKIESEILALTDDGTACCVSDDKGAYLAKLIEERKDTLDALFQATPNEVMRMDKLNDQLKAITRQMYERVAIVNEDAAKINGRTSKIAVVGSSATYKYFTYFGFARPADTLTSLGGTKEASLVNPLKGLALPTYLTSSLSPSGAP